MSNITLYDRIINVTLISDEIPNTVIKSIIPMTSERSFTIGKNNIKHFYNNNGNTTLRLYEGYSHYEYTKGGKQVKVPATGLLYKYDDKTVDYFNQGLRPNGTDVLQKGDRILIYKKGVAVQKWHVAFTKPQTKTGTSTHILELKCKDTGMKPDITLSINLIPGGFCYKAILKIKNFNTGPIDIRKWNRMVITAGYNTYGSTAEYDCPIFTSYIESPNPDGVTVFEGLTVGYTGSNLTLQKQALRVIFKGGMTTVGDLIHQVAKGLGLSDSDHLLKEHKDIIVKVPVTNRYADNGLALINWLRDTIASVLYTETRRHVLIQVLQNNLITCLVDGPNNIDVTKISSEIIQLNAVTGAQFSGTALTVEAPWIPSLKPGDVFSMRPEFINGSKLPNTMSSNAYKNQKNWYRCITMSVDFSTTGNSNRMSILAIPAQYVNQEDIRTMGGGDIPQEQLESWYRTWQEGHNMSGTEITIGNSNNTDDLKKELKAKESQVIKTVDPKQGMFGVPIVNTKTGVPTLTGVTFVDYIDNGYCLSRVAELYYDSLIIQAPENIPFDTPGLPSSGMIPSNNLWPIIAVATYQKSQADPRGGWAGRITFENPDYVRAGDKLYIPVITSMEQLIPLREIFKFAVEKYKDIKNYESYIKFWECLYVILGGHW